METGLLGKAPVRQALIPSVLETLNGELVRLTDLISGLEVRIRPILRTVNDEVQDSENPPPSNVKMVADLETATRKVTSLCKWITSLTERCEL